MAPKSPASRTAKKSPGKRPARKNAAAKKAPSKRPAGKKTAAKRIPARADKGVGEAAVQARIKALSEPSRSIIAKLHSIVKKNGPDLEPSVKWGFAVYSRDGKMLLVASPFTKYARFGFTLDAKVKDVGDGWIEYRSVDDINEAKVAAWVKLVAK